MKSNNICKFILPGQENGISISCFILETNLDTMREKIQLTQHRMILVSEGEGSFICDGKQIPLAKGNLVFCFKDEIMCVQAEENFEYTYIQFDGERAKDLFARFNIHKNNRLFSGFDGLIPLWKESLVKANEQTIDLVSESILLYTFSRMNVNGVVQDNLINRIVEFTERNFRDCDMSIGYISKELAYNPKYISHEFKKQMGIGFAEYLRTLRIKYAVSLFEHGMDSVKNVALLSGFSDPLYFSTVFKKTVGVSPTDYIRTKSV